MPRDDAAILKEFDTCHALTASSKKTLRPYMDKWIHLFKGEEQPLSYVIQHPEESMKRLKRIRPPPSLHARHHYLNAVNSLLRHVKWLANDKRYDVTRDTWRAMTSDNWEPVRDRMDSNRPTERQSVGMIRFEDVVAARDKLPYASDERILLGMFTYLPPARGGDYHALRVVKGTTGDCDQGNCVVVTSTQVKIVLRKFKTVQKYGIIEHLAPIELADEIRESLRLRPRKYLFHHVDDLDEPYSRSAFSDWSRMRLKSIFGKPTTLTIIRHAFISDTVDFNRPIKELQQLASSMGHTITTQKRYQHIASPSS